MTARNRHPVFFVLSIVSGAALVAGALFVRAELQVTRSEPVQEAHATPAVPVRVATVQQRPVGVRAQSYGFLQPYTEVTVAAEVPGVVAKQWVEVSDAVRKGEPLFKIDDAVRKIEHERALASAVRANARYELADANWKRIEALRAKDSSVPIEDVEARTGLSAARAGAAEAELAVRQAALSLERTSVLSPIDGVVSRIFIRRGEFAQTGQPTAQLIEIDRLKLVTELMDRDVVWLRVGQECVLATPLFPLEEFSGTVIRVFPKAMPASRKFEVEVEVPNADDRLRPGFFMRALFGKPRDSSPDEPARCLVVPRVAVSEENDRQFCYVVEPHDQSHVAASLFRVRRVVIVAVPIPAEPENLRVLSGLNPHDRVVIKGSQHLSDGATVRMTE